MADIKFKTIVLDKRHKGHRYFKYRIEFIKYDSKHSRINVVENFAELVCWFTQQYGIGYDFDTWEYLAGSKSNKLNPYWCFDIDKLNNNRYIYIWNDDSMVMYNLVFGGNNA